MASERDEAVITAFRAGEEPPGMHRDRLLILTTLGRRSGEHHATPVMVLPDAAADAPDSDASGVSGSGQSSTAPSEPADAGALLILASGNGSPLAPAWYLNLVADPRVHVEVDGAAYDATATTVTGAERTRAWASILERAPFFAEHEQRAGREIPVVRLSRS